MENIGTYTGNKYTNVLINFFFDTKMYCRKTTPLYCKVS